jgi:hypothetical protein
VEPSFVSASSLESRVPLNYNIVSLFGEYTGRLSFYGQGAGKYPTGASVAADVIEIAMGTGLGVSCKGEGEVDNTAELHRYYVRTAEKLDALVEREPKEYTGAIGKAAHTAKWYIAIPVSEAESFTFTESLTYDITFNESNRTIDMLLEKIYVGEDGAYLLFSCYDLSLVPAFSRAQSVKIRTGSVSGYKIPAEALTKLYNENGVFILVGSRVEFRRVTVIADGDRYYIVNTYASDSEEGAVSDIPYLNANDLIITSGNDLYDGKSLD